MKRKRSFRGLENIRMERRFILYVGISGFLLLGIIMGAIFANQMNDTQSLELALYMDEFFVRFHVESLNQTFVLKDALLKYGKTVGIAWILGFTVIGIPFSILIILLKGFTYGFTSAFLIKQYGMSGLWFGFLSYIPQNLILIPMFVFVVHGSIEFALKSGKNKHGKARFHKDRTQEWIEYGLILLVGMACVILASVIETYVTPSLMKSLLPNLL